MAARTMNASGDFNDGTKWVGGVAPVNGDSFTINLGVDCTMNEDQSAFATGMLASTCNGTLRFSNSSGGYLKMAGNLTLGAAASLLINGGVVTAFPAALTAVIQFTGAFGVVSTTTTVVDIRCQDTPTHKYGNLSGAESIGATVLEVNFDPTSAGNSAYWAVGAIIRIDDINQAVESEERVIQSVSSSSITITAGLTAAKSAGAYIILVSRNVKIIGAGAVGTGLSTITNGFIAAEVRGFSVGINAATTCTINGTISGCATGVQSVAASTVNANFTGCTNGVNASTNVILTGLISGITRVFSVSSVSICCVVSGIISGCSEGMSGNSDMLLTGSIRNCNFAIMGALNLKTNGAILENNNFDLRFVRSGRLFNTQLNSSTEFLGYNSDTNRKVSDYIESIDHDGIVGNYKAWVLGGLVTTSTATVFDLRPRSYQHAPESTTYPVFMKREVLVPAGETLSVTCYARKTVTMSYLPRLWLFSAEKDPLIFGSPDAQDTMTDSVDAWETLEAELTNSTDSDKTYVVMTLAKNATGNVYFDPVISTGGGAGRLVNGGLVAA